MRLLNHKGTKRGFTNKKYSNASFTFTFVVIFARGLYFLTWFELPSSILSLQPEGFSSAFLEGQFCYRQTPLAFVYLGVS